MSKLPKHWRETIDKLDALGKEAVELVAENAHLKSTVGVLSATCAAYGKFRNEVAELVGSAVDDSQVSASIRNAVNDLDGKLQGQKPAVDIERLVKLEAFWGVVRAAYVTNINEDRYCAHVENAILEFDPTALTDHREVVP
jgi:hypothetical protein